MYLSLRLHISDCQQNSTNCYILAFYHNDFLSSIQSLLSSDSSFITRFYFALFYVQIVSELLCSF